MPRPPAPHLLRVALALLALVVFGSTACSSGDDPVLTVDGWTLSRDAFSDQLRQIADNEGYVAARSADGDSFRVFRSGTDEFDPEFVAEFLNERVTFQLAEAEVARLGLTVTDEDRQRAIATIVPGLASGSIERAEVPAESDPDGPEDAGSAGSMPPGTASGSVTDGRAVLDAFGSYRDVLINGVANLQVLQADLSADITGDDQLRLLYDQIAESTATQACVRHILVQAGSGRSDPTSGELIVPTEDEYVGALGEIAGIGQRVAAGEDFAVLAAEVSDDEPTRNAGGDLGCAPRGSYSASFDEAIWTQEIGVVGPPVRSEFGYHLILVTDRRTLTFEEMRDDLRVAVDAQSNEALQNWLTTATRGASVTVDSGVGTWDADVGLVRAVGALEAPPLDLTPEDPNNPSDDLTPQPSSTTTMLLVPSTTAPATEPTAGGGP